MKKLTAVLAVILILGAAAAACWMVNVRHESQIQDEKIVKLRRMAVIEQSADTEQNDSSQVEPGNTPKHNISLLKKRNPDCIGWVSIPGTGIDFPVVQNGDFYLKHDFEGNYTDYGLPFLDERCCLDTSDQLIIYGHHMNDGSMFSSLLDYADNDYCTAHPEIILETEQGTESYLVAAVVREKGSYAQGEWSLFDQINMSVDSFHTLVGNLVERKLYDTGWGLVFGDRLLTLVTCEYSQDNGRLAVIARKLSRNYY